MHAVFSFLTYVKCQLLNLIYLCHVQKEIKQGLCFLLLESKNKINIAMKVLLIKASDQSDFKEYKKRRGSPSQNIFSTASAIADRVDLELFDETIHNNVNYDTDADLVGIFFSTPDAIRAYEHAAKFYERGKTVFFGGLHASFMPEEALENGFSVIVGESEGVIHDLLDDFENRGVLQPIYKRKTPLDLAELKPFPTHLISQDEYDYFWTVVVSRGCPNHCHFCVVNPFFGNIRYRPIENIVREIEQSGAQYIELHSDNLTVNREWAKNLFKAIAPLNIKWAVATEIKIADDPEMLDLAAKSGLSYVLTGLETPSKEALQGNGKGFVDPRQVKEKIQKLHDHGVVVDAAMMFGFDQHDSSIFERSLDFALESKIDVCEPVIQIPFPGTNLYKQLDKEGRILTKDWSRYNGTDVVYQPKLMTPEELLEGPEWFYWQFNSMSNWTKRKLRQFKHFGGTAFSI
jgi:radical SAM superfamily enzyme YgiQ (UPF0313 family)